MAEYDRLEEYNRMEEEDRMEEYDRMQADSASELEISVTEPESEPDISIIKQETSDGVNSELELIIIEPDSNEKDRSESADNVIGPVSDLLSKLAGVEEDIWQNILKYLDILSLLNLELTCHNIHSLLQHSDIWRKKYEALTQEIDILQRDRQQKFSECLQNTANYPTSMYKKVLARKLRLENNFSRGKCRKSKLSFYDVVGFNGDLAVVKSFDCGSIFVHDEELLHGRHVHDLFTGKRHIVNSSNTFAGFEITQSCVQNGVLAVLREPMDLDPHEDEIVEFPQVAVLETYTFSDYSHQDITDCKLKSQSNLIPNTLSRHIKIKLFDQKILVVTKNEDHEEILNVFIFTITGPNIKQSSKLNLVLPANMYNMSGVFDLLIQEHHMVWYTHNCFLCVWALGPSGANADDLIAPSFVVASAQLTRTAVPPVSVTAFDLSWPHLLVGGSDGRAQVFQHVSRNNYNYNFKKVRVLEHDIDSGYNVGWRQVSISATSNLIVSLTECGWLVGWDRRGCLARAAAASSAQLRLWTINTRHATPVVSFVLSPSRIVTLERHKMTSDWDVRMMVVVRDFWRYQDNRAKDKSETDAKTKSKNKRSRSRAHKRDSSIKPKKRNKVQN